MTDIEATPADATSALRWCIRVRGVVQGVGYRPFVYRFARELGLTGWVLNDPEGVLIEVDGDRPTLLRFVAGLTELAPALAHVTGVSVETEAVSDVVADGFVISQSEHTGARTALIPTDTHVCADCQYELRDPTDRRFGYPFINCTNCGPRYSLVQDLPYDRAQTTMSSFVMCGPCQAEYEDPADRRYHAQPNACSDCGPRLLSIDAEGGTAESEPALARAVEALQRGGIVAIKSVGGFHLAVDATNAAAVDLLRARKRRDSKPFAVMVRDLDTVREVVELSAAEQAVISSPARPIVLLRKRKGALPDRIAPRNPNLGVMLPSAPHHHLLVDQPGLAALVMTSGNISGHPIAYRNEDALAELLDIAELILYHDRDIQLRVDDSVVRLSAHPELAQPLLSFIRRARGYAPYPVTVGHSLAPIVAYGAELKTTVALTSGTQVQLSQHIGDLKNDETFAAHRLTAAHIAHLYRLSPSYAAVDLHPGFRNTRSVLGAKTATVVQVQHHHAHMASCMADNRLVGTTIGVVFDGAGYGTDDTIWGGEFLLGDFRQVDRVARLRRLPLLGGDSAVREPIRTGYALALDTFGDESSALAAFPALAGLTEQQRRVFGVMASRGVNSPLTSSMGRLFDAVAALLDVCGRAEYEAQGPIELEGLLERNLDLDVAPGYVFDRVADGPLNELDSRPVIRAVAADLAAGVSVDQISRRFHTAVVEMVVRECGALRQERAVDQVVLSGGVFLNEFLLINCVTRLRQEGFSAHTHQQVPTNDGGIALGQVLVADARIADQLQSLGELR